MIEWVLWWFLLPIAALSGWVIARYGALPTFRNLPSKLSPDYFKGLNYLFNEQPDKAIEAFIKLIDIDSDTVETHLALGAFFRRRGEVNRAIRIHQNLVARPTLNPSERNIALLELSHDYRRAGLLDRAENLFLELTLSPEHRVHAYQQLLDIYQQEHDWEQAIHTAHELAKAGSEPTHILIAQYYCEQAECCKQQNDEHSAFQAIKHALEIDPKCVRASLLEGKFAIDNGAIESAMTAFKRVEKQDPAYLSEIVEPLFLCYQQVGKLPEFSHYLHDIIERHSKTISILVLAEILQKETEHSHFSELVIEQLRKRPSIKGLDYLVNFLLTHDAMTKDALHDYLLLMKEVLAQLLKHKPLYQCVHCGFTGKSLYWQCPSCKQWSSIKPLQSLEGDV